MFLITFVLGHKGQLAVHPFRRNLAGHFTPPLCAFKSDTLALSRVHSPNNGKVGIMFLYPHSRCFGSYFDATFLMYLVSSDLSFKTSSFSLIILIDPVNHRVSVQKNGFNNSIKSKSNQITFVLLDCNIYIYMYMKGAIQLF